MEEIKVDIHYRGSLPKEPFFWWKENPRKKALTDAFNAIADVLTEHGVYKRGGCESGMSLYGKMPKDKFTSLKDELEKEQLWEVKEPTPKPPRTKSNGGGSDDFIVTQMFCLGG